MSSADFIERRLVLAPIAGAAIWLVWIGSLLLGDGVFDKTGQLVGADHLAFYSSAKLIAEGRPADIYHLPTLAEYQVQLVGEKWEGKIEGYRNPPFYALLYVHTSGLSFISSFVLWNIAGVVALAVGIWCLRPSRWWKAAGWTLTFYPVFATVSFGQNSFFSLAIFALTYFLLTKRRPFLAGMVAGLLLFKPPLLLGLGVWWLLDLRRAGWCWAGAFLTGSVLLVGSGLIIPEAWESYRTHFETLANYGNYGLWNLHNPKGFFALLFPGCDTFNWVAATLCSVIAIIGFIRFFWKYSDNPALMFVAVVFLTLWASPHTMIYEWTLALIPAILLWEYLPQGRPTWRPLFAMGWGALMISTPGAKLMMDVAPFALQVSVPVLGYVGVRIWQELMDRDFRLS